MYLFPKFVSGSGPRISIAILSIGLVAILVCNGAQGIFDGDFLDAHFSVCTPLFDILPLFQNLSSRVYLVPM